MDWQTLGASVLVSLAGSGLLAAYVAARTADRLSLREIEAKDRDRALEQAKWDAEQRAKRLAVVSDLAGAVLPFISYAQTEVASFALNDNDPNEGIPEASLITINDCLNKIEELEMRASLAGEPQLAELLKAAYDLILMHKWWDAQDRLKAAEAHMRALIVSVHA